VKYRIVAEIILDSEVQARGALEILKWFRGLMLTIRAGEPAEERSRILLERHYHDEDPSRPCEVIEEVTA